MRAHSLRRTTLLALVMLCAARLNAAAQDEAVVGPQVRLGKTAFKLVVTQPVSSKTARVGDSVPLRVVGDVKVDGFVVIADRAPATGTVVEVKRAGRAWRAGSLGVRGDAVTAVNGAQLPLSFLTVDRGAPTHAAETWTGAAMQTMGLVLLALPLAPLQHGNEAIVPAGRMFDAFVGETPVVIDRRALVANQPAPTEQHPRGVITVYSAPTRGVYADIWCGNAYVVSVYPGQRAELQLPAGRYWCHARSGRLRSEPLALDLGDRKDYLLRPSFDDGPAKGTGRLRLDVVSGALANAEAEFCQVVPVRPSRKVTVQQLQATPAPQTAPAVRPSYRLAPRRLEMAVTAAMHEIEWEGTQPNGMTESYSTGASGAFGGALGVGVTPHFSAQAAVTMTAYRNDRYSYTGGSPSPYLATAKLLTLTSGMRWDIRGQSTRVRPYAGGGLVAARFAGVKRGATERCVEGGECNQVAPELFTGTQVSGYFDLGVNLFAVRRWAFGVGVKGFPLRGNRVSPPTARGLPTGDNWFMHSQVYVALVVRGR